MTDITVVTPFYNTQDYLHKNIKSVLSQVGVKLKLILIDDGSTDNSKNIAKIYEQTDNRVKLITQENLGQGPARNKGIDVADSEFIYFVDSDDFLGEGTLKKLLSASREYELDLCSPGVPARYFDKRLELIPCLPCKSQFMKLETIHANKLYQPSSRSGQDGVFSHLFLTHSKRIAMNVDAEFHYTHARPGSTFSKYKKLPSEVPSLIRSHLEFIEKHYDENDLWGRNSDRLMMFLSDETIENRIKPHINEMSLDQINDCRLAISKILKKSLKNLKVFSRKKDKYIASLEAFSDGGGFKGFSPPEVHKLSNKNFHNKKVKIVKYWNDNLAPKKKPEKPVRVVNHNVEKNHENVSINEKLDFIVNVINNNSYMIASMLRHHLPSLGYCGENITVSLTSLPSRLNSLDVTLTSLLKQSLLPKRIVVWLSDSIDSDYLPPAVRAFEKNGVLFKFVKDVGPHTKLLYALKEYGESNIVTVDDDIIYPTNMLSCLVRAHKFSPTSICANWARELAFDNDGKVLGVRDGKLLTPPARENDIEQKEEFKHKKYKLGFPYGTSGVLYPPNCFDSIVHNVDIFSELCPKEDDIWFRACSLKKGTDVVVTNLGMNPKHHSINGSQVEALRHHNHGKQENIIQMRKVFDYFNFKVCG